jgi:hypothetical protein
LASPASPEAYGKHPWETLAVNGLATMAIRSSIHSPNRTGEMSTRLVCAVVTMKASDSARQLSRRLLERVRWMGESSVSSTVTAR